MARAKPTEGVVKARVLIDCEHGKPNDIVEIDAAQAENLAGVLDTDPAAVTYAESLAEAAQ
jgi:hypothetical protein